MNPRPSEANAPPPLKKNICHINLFFVAQEKKKSNPSSLQPNLLALDANRILFLTAEEVPPVDELARALLSYH